MASKKLWVSALSKDEQRISRFNSAIHRYGFDVAGHIWLDEPEKLAWRAAYDEFQKRKTNYWVILADEASLKSPGIVYALNLMSFAMRRDLNDVLPVIVMGQESLREKLPNALKHVKIIDDNAPGWEAKLVANTLRLPAADPLPYRIDVYGDEKIGQWFEIGPTVDAWSGVIFGASGKDVSLTFHAVGPAGKLPEKTTLEYAREGIKIEAGGEAFEANSVRNQIDPATSYFVRVKGQPESLLIMPDESGAEAEAPEAYVIRLK
jgi:hypothetical protein